MTSASKQGWQNPHLLRLPPPPLISMSVLFAQSQHRFNAIVFGLRSVEGKTPEGKTSIAWTFSSYLLPSTTTTTTTNHPAYALFLKHRFPVAMNNTPRMLYSISKNSPLLFWQVCLTSRASDAYLGGCGSPPSVLNFSAHTRVIPLGSHPRLEKVLG